MSQKGKITVKNRWAFTISISFCIFIVQLTATAHYKKANLSNIVFNTDTTSPKKIDSNKALDTTRTRDSATIHTIDTLTISKDSIDAPIEYAASDSGVLIIPTKEFILYGKAKVKNKDINLEAATIEYKQADNMMKAFGATDTTGSPYSKPKLTQGPTNTISDSITFNLKTLKGLTKNTYVQEGEMFINAQVLKKINATEFFGFRTQFTTCNLDTPHFAFRARKIKLITNKIAISGPATPEFEGVPVPVGIPFGIYPLQRGRSSGILPPAFNVSEDFGLGLEGLGYYKVINDYIDVITRANIYSYGGWTLNINPKYQKRYKFVGGVNLTLQNTRALNRSFGSFTKNEFNEFRSFMLNWSHSQDQRVRPGTTFSANVNFGSTRFNQTILNNPFVNFQNQLTSNINYTKDFRGKANISVNANHSQNSNTRLVSVNLPTLTASVVTFYPFQRKEQVGSSRWYEKIGIGYSGNLTNQVNFYDTAFNFRRMLDTLQWGATHNIPITLSLPSLGPITLAPSITYEERWYGQTNESRWNSSAKKIDTVLNKGFFTARQMSFGLSANTRIFGTFQFKKKSKIQAIRHEVRPNIGISYRPDLVRNQFYDLQVDSTGRTVRTSKFNGIIPGAYGGGTFGGLTFGVDNLLEMKVKDKSDTSKPNATKKVKLIDGFGFNSSYNLVADSFALEPFTFYARSTLFEIFNITAGFIVDPYQVDSIGTRKNKFLWTTGGFKPGRITSGNIAVSANFKSKPRDGVEDDNKRNIPLDPFMTPDEQQRQLQFARSNPAEFTDFNIPWSLSLNYSLSFSRQLQPDFTFRSITTSSLNFNGDFSLTEKWKIGGTGFIDVSRRSLQQFSMFITREMHCWQLAVNVQPIGLFRNFSITLNPKSGILRDLRINRARSFSSQ